MVKMFIADRRTSILPRMKTALLLETIVRFHSGCTHDLSFWCVFPPLLLYTSVLIES